MASINQNQLGLMPIPIPSLLEQSKIVEKIEQYFSISNYIENNAEQALQRAERLHQTILNQALEGKLIPQDANDDPAIILLQKIKERSTHSVMHRNRNSKVLTDNNQMKLVDEY